MSQISDAVGGFFGAAAGREATLPLPRGRHALDRDVVVLSQRTRLLDGMVRAVAERGYSAATIADALRHARVSRATFYEHFAGKEECFLAAYEMAARVHHRRVVEAAEAEPEWRHRLRAGTTEYLEALDEEPVYARALMIEVGAAGPRAAALRGEAIMRYATLQREWYAGERERFPLLPPLPARVFEASAVAGNQLVTDELLRPDPHVRQLLPLLMYLQLSLFGMHSEGLSVLQGRPRRPAMRN